MKRLNCPLVIVPYNLYLYVLLQKIRFQNQNLKLAPVLLPELDVRPEAATQKMR